MPDNGELTTDAAYTGDCTSGSGGRKRPSLRRNALSNGLALTVNIAVGFLLTPAIAAHLGEERFGMWMLAFSLVGYFGLLRLGVGAAVLRYIPVYRGQGRSDKVSSIVSTAMVVYLAVAAVIVLVAVVLADTISRFFGGTPELTWLIRLTGLAAALECPFLIFDTSIRAYEGYVYANLVAIVTGLARAIALAACIVSGGGLVAMGCVQVLTSGMALAGAGLVFRLYCTGARIRPRAVNLADLSTVFFFGLAVVLTAVADALVYATPKVIVGRLISLEAVGLLGVALLLVHYYSQAVQCLTKVFMPRFSYLWGRGATQEMRHLFIRGSRYTTVFAGLIALGMWVLGSAFVRLWMGDEYHPAAGALMVLTTSALVLLSHRMSIDMLYGLGQQNYIAVIGLIEGVACVALTVPLSMRYGVLGTAVGVAIPIVIIRAILQARHACRLIDLSLWRYYAQCVLKPWVLAVALASFAWLTGVAQYASTWAAFLGLSAALVAVYGAIAYAVIFEPQDRAEINRGFSDLLTYTRRKPAGVQESVP